MTSPAGQQASPQPAAGPADKAKPAGSQRQEGPAGGKPSPAAAATAAAAAGAQHEGSPSRQQQQPQQSSPNGKAAGGGAAAAEEVARRQKRREAWEREQEAQRRWDLQRRLADISTDVEFLAREVRAWLPVGAAELLFLLLRMWGGGLSDGRSRLSSAVWHMARRCPLDAPVPSCCHPLLISRRRDVMPCIC